MRKLLAALASAAAAVGIVAATLTGTTSDHPGKTLAYGPESWKVPILPYIEQDSPSTASSVGNASSLMSLLPFIEQDNVYRLVDPA